MSIDFASMPSDSLYVKSKFQYEFGDYGFDKLNIGLRKQSSISNFEFIAMKKSFFGTYSEFANKDSSPLSLFYKIDYNTILSKHNFYLSTGYFREDSKFLFNNESDRFGQSIKLGCWNIEGLISLTKYDHIIARIIIVGKF